MGKILSLACCYTSPGVKNKQTSKQNIFMSPQEKNGQHGQIQMSLSIFLPSHHNVRKSGPSGMTQVLGSSYFTLLVMESRPKS